MLLRRGESRRIRFLRIYLVIAEETVKLLTD